MIPLLSLLPDAALPGPSLHCTAIFKLVSTSVPDPDTLARSGVTGILSETFAVKINTETVNM